MYVGACVRGLLGKRERERGAREAMMTIHSIGESRKAISPKMEMSHRVQTDFSRSFVRSTMGHIFRSIGRVIHAGEGLE